MNNLFLLEQIYIVGFEAAGRVIRSPASYRTNNYDEYLPILTGIFGFVIGLIVLFVVWKIFRHGVKRASMERKSLDSVLFEVRVPKSNDVDIQAADQMMSGFLGISKSLKGWEKLFGARYYISFEIVGLPESIRFYVNVPAKLATLVEKQINSSYPEAYITRTEEYNMFAPGQHVEFCELLLENDPYKPITTYEELTDDPISAITSSMSKLSPGDAIAYQVVIVPSDGSWRSDGKKYVKKIREQNADPEKSKIDVEEDTLAAIEKKATKGGFEVDIRLVSASPNKEIAKINLDNLVYAFEQFTRQASNKFKKKKFDLSMNKTKRDFVREFVYRFPKETVSLNTSELATIFHFPNNNVNTPHIHWLTSKRAPAAGDIPSNPQQGSIYLGVNDYRGLTKPIQMYLKDRRRHFYYVGKTGAGKTVMLQNMILQDIMNGQGIAFLDPHGDAVEWLLDRIPANRVEDVIYFNPADENRPIGLNIMEYYGEMDKHIVVNGFLGLLNKLFDPHNQGITGPRFEQAVRNAMLTVMSVKGTGLLEVMRVLQNDKFAEQFFPYLHDDVVKRYWTEQIANTNEFHKSEVLGYIVSKFDRFITNTLMRNIIAQSKSGFDFRSAMDNRKILLINLSKGLIGEENSKFLGLLIIPKILQAAMARADQEESKRADFFLYVDEFQNFATPDFAVILSEARKYRLNLIVANQYIAQMTDEVRDSVFGNVGSLGSFKVGVNDAQYLEQEFSPVFTKDDIINLENLNMYIKLLSNGEYTAPFSLKLDTDLVFKSKGDKKIGNLVKQLSRLKYGRDKRLVEAEIKARENSTSLPGEDGSATGQGQDRPPQPTAFKPDTR
jgi:hypothetical protein